MDRRATDRVVAARFALCLLSCLAAPGSAAAAGGTRDGALNATESAIVRHVEAGEASALSLLEQVVNINSGTLNLDGVRAVGKVFREQFDALGFSTHWVDGAAFGRAGHLIAEHPGPGPRVLLIGHLDTVFEKDSPFQRFERVNADTARGPGTSDMKGGDVVALYALRALQQAGTLKGLNVTVVFSGDEEDVGEPVDLARAALVEAATGAGVAIGLENGDDDPATAITARRGASSWILTTHGNSAHSSQIFSDAVGAGAIYELARILGAFYTRLHGEDFLTFNPGVMLGGAQVDFDGARLSGKASGKNNIVAPRAVASGDLRTLTLAQRDRVEARMQAIVNEHLPMTGAELRFDNAYPPAAPSPGNDRLLGMYDQVSRDLGYGPVTAVDPRRAGAADISFVSGRAKMCLDGLGLLGGGNHTEQEFADLRTYPEQTGRLAVLLYRLSRQ